MAIGCVNPSGSDAEAGLHILFYLELSLRSTV